MFSEWKCGCIFSVFQGRVRICDTHKMPMADGNGGGHAGLSGGGRRHYPANGEMVAGWTGK